MEVIIVLENFRRGTPETLYYIYNEAKRGKVCVWVVAETQMHNCLAL